MSAQDHCPEHKRSHPSCRLCKGSETVWLIIVGFKMQAGTGHMEHHNQVSGILYSSVHNICAENGLEVPKLKWEIPQKAVENDRAKILWDF